LHFEYISTYILQFGKIKRVALRVRFEDNNYIDIALSIKCERGVKVATKDSSYKEYQIQVGKRLRFLRKNRKLSLNDIIIPMKIARSTYNNWEAGSRTPDGENLKSLAKIFDTTVDYIVGATEDSSPINIDDMWELVKESKLVYKGKEINDDQAKALLSLIETYMKVNDKNEQ
jgi:transcriptional regulator with XRE-family HTH domain